MRPLKENEERMVDERPRITSPDGLNIIDPKTGWSLSNFWMSEWEHGREVAVVGVRAEDIWRTEKGLKLLGRNTSTSISPTNPYRRLSDRPPLFLKRESLKKVLEFIMDEIPTNL